MFFAFTALACGMFFFLYSIKYYLTIAVILSFSRSQTGDHATQTRNSAGSWQACLASPLRLESQDAGQAGEEVGYQFAGTISHVVQLERTPFVSIHVATYNEKRVIDRFLLAATAMEYPQLRSDRGR